MPLPKGYAILKGIVIDSQPATGSSPHFQVRVVDEQANHRISINVRSKYHPQELEFVLVPELDHPILDKLAELPMGVTKLSANAEERRTSGLALDFIRMNLFDRSAMKPTPMILPGPDNDLNERISNYVAFAMGDEANRIYAFGEPWFEPTSPDKYFGYLPGAGIHDIHMNQGNLIAQHKHEDGVYQDGGLIFYFAAENRWVGYFTKFQSQSWHTDDASGHALTGNGDDVGDDDDLGPQPDGDLRVLAALVNPLGPAPEREVVTLLNTTGHAVDLTGWKLLDKADHVMPLSGSLPAGGVVQVVAAAPLQLSNQGGLITLVNPAGLKVDGVAYTKAQAQREGRTLVFGR